MRRVREGVQRAAAGPAGAAILAQQPPPVRRRRVREQANSPAIRWMRDDAPAVHRRRRKERAADGRQPAGSARRLAGHAGPAAGLQAGSPSTRHRQGISPTHQARDQAEQNCGLQGNIDADGNLTAQGLAPAGPEHRPGRIWPGGYRRGGGLLGSTSRAWRSR